MARVTYTSDQIKNLKIMQVDGKFKVPGGRQLAKVKKLPNLLERAIPGTKECEAKIYIKPLSVNAAYQGRRFKTKEHDKYCDAVSLLLPNDLTIPDGYLKVEYEFGLSSNGGDWDNPVKPLQDILSKKYGFNDNKIMIATIKKVIVPKGKEYIKFNIEKFN